MAKFKENRKKMKELILYISEKCADDPYFGATKLNKILFLSDFWAYGELGRPITGMEYMKLPWGPVSRSLLPIQGEMEEDGDLAIQEARLAGYTQKRPVNTRSAKLDLFTAEEIALVDNVIAHVREASATAVSMYTHRWTGWKVADDQENIPYTTIFLSDDPITKFEAHRGKELAVKNDWAV